MDEVKQTIAGPRRKRVKPVVLWSAIILGIILVYGLFIFVYGYRLSPTQAVKANTDVPGNADLVEEIDLEWGECYLLQTPDEFFIAGCKKDGILWISQVSSWSNSRPDDAVKMLGSLSFEGGSKREDTTIFAVENSDPRVVYIEAGPGIDRVRQAAPADTPVVFRWSRIGIFDELSAKALDAEGRVLYEYRYLHGSSGHLDSRELNWYPVDQPSPAS